MLLVDTHIHVLAADTTKYPIDPIGGIQSEWSKGNHLTAEEFIEHMSAAGVSQATLVQASTVHGYDNTFCAECCARYPEKFVGVCCIDPLLPDGADTLSYWVTDWDMRGVRFFSAGSSVAEGRWIDDPATFPVWERAQLLGIPIAIQVRATGLGMVRNMLRRFEGVNVLLDHLGGAVVSEGPLYTCAQELLQLARFPNLYLKFSTNNVRAASEGNSTPEHLFRTLIETFGADRLAWGTNFPGTTVPTPTPYKDIVEEVRRALSFLSAKESEQVFGGTARSLYPNLVHPIAKREVQS
jgi:L-fuconolactonase